MLAVLAEFERDLISERTKSALSLKKSRGQRVGQIPFGYDLGDDGVKLMPNKKEQATLAEMRKMRSNGMTWRRIADELNARSRKSKSGSRWTLFTARKIGRVK